MALDEDVNATQAKTLRTNSDATGGKYSVQFYTYPEDLYGNGANKYGNSWVMININVVSGTKFSNRYSYVELSQEENRNFSNTELRNQQGIQTTEQVGKSAAILSAAKAGYDAVTNLNQNASTGQQIGNVIGKTIKGAAQGAGTALVALTPALVNKKETKRIDTAIQLPMPNNLITGYTMDWGEADTAIFDMLARGPKAAVETIKAAFTGDMETFKKSQGTDIAASIALGTQSFFGSGAVSAASGLAANPKKEMVFNGVGFRTFTLEYRFFPKTDSEALKIKNIIEALKFHMHPEYKSQGRFTFLYPSEFDITFFYKGNEHFWVNKIATSVLKNMRVNYTPDGLWASHETGSPNAIQITLEFQELSILTKETIDKGY